MFTVQQLSGRGTSTPCVARTMLQTIELCAPFELDEDLRKQLNRTAYDLMMRLVSCLDRAEPVIRQVAEAKRQLDISGIQIQPSGVAANLPAVVDLNSNAEAFLFAAKQALRDVGGLFCVFFNQSFEHRFNRAAEWATETFGPDDTITVLLVENAGWIERVIEMRNALEHPAGQSGMLTITNFRLRQPHPPLDIVEPRWFRTGETEMPIAADMTDTMDATLVLYEELLCACLRKADPSAAIDFLEIAEPDRDPVKPFRLRAVPAGLSNDDA